MAAQKVLLSGHYLTIPNGTGLLQYTLAVKEALPSGRPSFLVETEVSSEQAVNACTLIRKQEPAGHYFRSWCRNFKTRAGIPLQAAYMPVDSSAIYKADQKEYLNADFFSVPGGYHESNWIFHQSGKRPVVKVNAPFDIYHATNPAALRVKDVAEVVTIHDLIPLRLPSSISSPSSSYMKLVRQVCNDAAKVVTVSASTKKDVMSLLGISGDKIQVVYSCPSIKITNDHKLQETILRSYGLEPQGYILHMATSNLRKTLGV